MTDLVVRGGTVVTPDGVYAADLAIQDGQIAQIAAGLSGGREEIDARGLVILPGLIDAHVHFNEPGRTAWEGGASGSRALAAGGGTVFVDMPLNSSPCTIGAADFDLKRTALETTSIADFALWGGLVPGRVSEMADAAERGVVGFKAFMCDSGLPEFAAVDDATLEAGMREAARLGLPVAVHAERQESIRKPAGRSIHDFLASRPIEAELEAIERAISLAGETGAKLHIVHVSSGRGVALAWEGRTRGVDVSIETCPHYLCFTEEDMARMGAVAKCAPPLRPAAERDALWAQLLAGHVDLVASDHSPAEPAMKAVKDGDFVSVWGGIAGVQSTLAVLLDQGHHGRRLPLERIADLTAAAPARRFGIAGKGSLSPGRDADLVLVDLNGAFTLEARDLHQRHKTSPYAGRAFRGRIRRTIRRGETMYLDGAIRAHSRGRFIRSSHV
jgi:allantoinase